MTSQLTCEVDDESDSSVHTSTKSGNACCTVGRLLCSYTRIVHTTYLFSVWMKKSGWSLGADIVMDETTPRLCV
ncbi:hypothetical protein M404DRAFT_1006609 [Pisolithus tinctorius Marx 270]|uniref:Uncharacterized protein n=1 Tax=Pisolithus tinctorius Marx 270 TaxID=870435 RepID=A0A0C3JG29_PISTI|nr:hypothetical protein M404DRAFT_1006609 [Pisolithus tinctorius Marx 270]